MRKACSSGSETGFGRWRKGFRLSDTGRGVDAVMSWVEDDEATGGEDGVVAACGAPVFRGGLGRVGRSARIDLVQQIDKII